MTAAAVVLMGVAACGDDDDSSSGTTETTESPGTGSVAQSAQQLCNDLEGLNSTVQGINVDPDTTTISDLKDDLNQLRSEVSDVASSGSALAGAVGTALQSAFDQFESAIQDRPDDQTLESAGENARSAADNFHEAWDAALNALHCDQGS